MDTGVAVSASLADFLEQVDAGPKGLEDAQEAIRTVTQSQSSTLDLQQMGLNDEDLSTLVPEIIKLAPQLKSLNLFLNELTTLPDKLSALVNLESLFVGANPLKTIPDGVFQGLVNLEELDIGYSEELSNLPASISSCKNLRVLYAGNGRLHQVPVELFECTNLEELHLYGNALESLPPDISKLSKLRFLNVGRNRLATLPEELSSCSLLEKLHVYENDLTGFPSGIDKIEALRVVNADCNPDLKPVPREVLMQASAQAVAAFYAQG